MKAEGRFSFIAMCRHAVAVCALALAGCGGGGSGPTPTPQQQAAADAAFQYGYPLVETMRVCDRFPTLNTFAFRSTLTTAQDRVVVRVNNDTLTSTSCAYLGASWVLVTMPPTNGRYMSLQVIDAYTNNAAIRGPLQVPAGGAQYVLHLAGSSNAGLPAGVPVIEVNTPYVFLLLRTLVNGPPDLAAADAAQRQFTLQANSAVAPVRPVVAGATAAEDFFLKLMLRLAQNPPPSSEAALVNGFAAGGVVASMSPSLNGVSAEQRAAWETAYTRGLAAFDAGNDVLGMLRSGWRYPTPDFAVFDTDYFRRAVTARLGLFALSPVEAVYISGVATAAGVRLNGNTPVTLRLPATWPPVDARGFWSLTLYAQDGFFVPNALNRYSIGAFTPGVVTEPDGSKMLTVQCTDPGGARTANWLPAPCGPYGMVMRLYLPDAAVLTPQFALPPIQ